MNKPHRLFDFLDQQIIDGPIDGLLAAKENGEWKKYSSEEVRRIVDQLSAGLLAMGISQNDMSVEGRDKIAIVSKNRPEWIFLDLAIQQIGAVLVPIYPTAHINDIEFVFKDAQVKLAFVNDKELYEKIAPVRQNCPSLMKVFSLEHVEGVSNWKEILSKGKQEHFQHIPECIKKINTEDLLTIIYTSGTTGTPKGVMLSHHNVLSNVLTCLPYLPVSRNARVLSFLPLNHIFERMVTYVYLFAGCSIHYAESMDTLGDNIREVRPQMFTTVPRLLEKVYERIMKKGEEQKGIKKKLFYWAVKLGEQYDIRKKGSIGYRMQLAIANKLVFSKWRAGLGNSLKAIVTGAAACQVRLIKIFTSAGITVLEGYGLTETSPVISVNRMNHEDRMFGTVGSIIGNVQVKIAEDGEIICKGPNVMMGYYKRPDLTAEVIEEGWFHTGDIGVLVDDKFLKITDRKKEIFKTSGGKFVAPQPIENKMVESPFIEQIMVVGAGEKFTGALIVPAYHNLKEWCRLNKIADSLSNDELIKNQQVIDQYASIVEGFNKNFGHIEQIKKFRLLPHEWSIEGGEMTPTLKLKRKVILEKYKDDVRQIYLGS